MLALSNSIDTNSSKKESISYAFFTGFLCPEGASAKGSFIPWEGLAFAASWLDDSKGGDARKSSNGLSGFDGGGMSDFTDESKVACKLTVYRVGSCLREIHPATRPVPTFAT